MLEKLLSMTKTVNYQEFKWDAGPHVNLERLTIKEGIKVTVIVKVNTRVHTAGAVIFGRKSSLKENKYKFWLQVLVYHDLFKGTNEMTVSL